LKKLAGHFARRGPARPDLGPLDPQAVLEAVSPLRFRGGMIVFHVSTRRIEFNYDQASAFEDLEAVSRSRRAGGAGGTYRALIREHSQALRSSSPTADRLRADQPATPLDARSSATSQCESKYRVR
jgi:hypothetical protein